MHCGAPPFVDRDALLLKNATLDDYSRGAQRISTSLSDSVRVTLTEYDPLYT